MAEQSRDPSAPPGGEPMPRLELAPEVEDPKGSAGSSHDPFAPPVENEALDLALEIAKPSRRPGAQTVAPDPAPPVRSLSAERSSTSGVFRVPPPKVGSVTGSQRVPERGASGVFRMPEPPGAADEYKGPRGGTSHLVLWAFAGLGVLAVIGSAVRFFRSGPEPEASAATSGSTEPAAAAQPTVWKPVELGPNVLVTVDVSPRSARLLLDGEPMMSNPIPLARGSKHTIGALADGFEGALTTVTADKRKTVRLVLKRAKR
jgi:hypothetical protein